MGDEARVDWNAVGEAGLAEMVALRRAIHREPEIGLHCPLTAEKVKAALAGLPLEIREGPSTTGFVVILRGGRDNGRTVLLRGDHDALPMQEETGLDYASTIPGAMHACGHDSHTAMLVGAAKALCARRDTLPGTVVFMFQPGEEGHHGARHMIADGLLADPAPEGAFALHISPNLARGLVVGRSGPIMAATDTLSATIRGAWRPCGDAARLSRSDPDRLRDRHRAADLRCQAGARHRPGGPVDHQIQRRVRAQYRTGKGRAARHAAGRCRSGRAD